MKPFAALTALLRNTSGAAAVEAMMIMPLAVLILVLGMEAGHFLYTEHQVIKGVREAARYASRLPLSTFNCTGATSETAYTGSARDAIANVAVYGTADGSGVARVWTWSAASGASEVEVSYACVANTTGLYVAAKYAPQIAVTGKPDYPTLFGAMTYFNSSRKLFARQQAAAVGI